MKQKSPRATAVKLGICVLVFALAAFAIWVLLFPQPTISVPSIDGGGGAGSGSMQVR